MIFHVVWTCRSVVVCGVGTSSCHHTINRYYINIDNNMYTFSFIYVSNAAICRSLSKNDIYPDRHFASGRGGSLRLFVSW